MSKTPNSFSPEITRRDFLNGAAAGAGALLLGGATPGLGKGAGQAVEPMLSGDWYGYGGVGDYSPSHGNTPEVVNTAHRLRDGAFQAGLESIELRESYDLVIVGSGMAGLSAALEFTKHRRGGQRCLLLDNHPVFGGEAKENEFNVDGTRLIAPQGANGFFVPEAVDDWRSVNGDPRYYAELNLPREFELAEWPSKRKPLGFCGDNYGYLVRGLMDQTSVGHFFPDKDSNGGQWAVDMWQRNLQNTPLSNRDRNALLHWYRAGARRRFGSDREAIRKLDTLSYHQFLERELGMSKAAARQGDLFVASACGLGGDAVSAYAAYNLPMPGLADSPPPELRRTSFPGGNSGFVRHLVKRMIPDAIAGEDSFEDIITGRINFGALDRDDQPLRIRQGATVLAVQHEGDAANADSVRVVYSRDGVLHGARAKAVVMATGGWINRHVVRDLPEDVRNAYGEFVHAPFLVANVALTNWRFLYKLGITAAIWDRGEGDFGYTCNIRNPMQVGDYRPPLDPSKPTVLSFYTPFFYPGEDIRAQVARGRMELLQTSFQGYERQITGQMEKLFAASGFDPRRDVAGLILNRWGHAYSVPYPGFYGGEGKEAPRDIIRRGYGRIAFGHSELDGLQHYGPAADDGRRAFHQVFSAL
jgi:spermidine dehydrogenase